VQIRPEETERQTESDSQASREAYIPTRGHAADPKLVRARDDAYYLLDKVDPKRDDTFSVELISPPGVRHSGQRKINRSAAGVLELERFLAEVSFLVVKGGMAPTRLAITRYRRVGVGSPPRIKVRILHGLPIHGRQHFVGKEEARHRSLVLGEEVLAIARDGVQPRLKGKPRCLRSQENIADRKELHRKLGKRASPVATVVSRLELRAFRYEARVPI
jgi:hypothetical protein